MKNNNNNRKQFQALKNKIDEIDIECNKWQRIQNTTLIGFCQNTHTRNRTTDERITNKSERTIKNTTKNQNLCL